MEKLNLFREELYNIITAKPIFRCDPAKTEQKITQFEHEHGVAIPDALKAYYLLTGGQAHLYVQSYIKVHDVEDLEICSDEQHGKYLVFASATQTCFGYFFEKHEYMQTYGRISWNSYIMSDLESFLLYTLAGALIPIFDNIVSVRMSFAKVDEDDYPDHIAKKLSVPVLRSIDHVCYTAFCNPETKMIALYDMDGSPKLLLGCDDYDALSSVMQSQKCTLRKKDGYRVQNPSKYVKGEPPVTFQQKMDLVSQVNFPKIVRMDVRHPELPESLRYLHELYSRKKAFFDSDMHVMKIADYGDEPYQVIADENQYGFSFAVKSGTQDVYITCDGETYEPYEASLEDVLLYISCVQGMGLLAVNCIADPAELDRLRPYFFEVCRNDKFQCFVCPDRRMLMIYEEDMLCIAGKTDRYMQVLEEDSGVEFSYN